MSFATINGWALPVLEDGVDDGEEVVGDVGNTFAGGTMTAIRKRKNEIDVDIAPVNQEDGWGIRGLAKGAGHRWSFDDAATGGVDRWKYSSRGLPLATGTLLRSTTTPSPKFGTAYGEIAAAGVVTWNTGYTGDTTLMVWFYTSAAWHHYIVKSDGKKWVDGVRNDAASTPFIAISAGGIVTLGDAASGVDQQFDDLVVLNFLITTGMAVAFGTATLAFSDLPKLHLGGDVVSSLTDVLVPGEVSVTRFTGAVGAALTTAMRIKFTMVSA